MLEIKSTSKPATITLPPAADKNQRINITIKGNCIVNSITLKPGEMVEAEPNKYGGWIIKLRQESTKF